MNALVLQPLPLSRSTLALVVSVHLVAGLLILQMIEARRYIEPVPLMVSLLPAMQPFEPAAEPGQPRPQGRSERTPDPVVEPESVAVAESVPASEPVPAPAEARHEPKPIERVPVRERALAVMPEPVRVPIEPMAEKIVTPVPLFAPEPPPRVLTPAPEMPTARAEVVPPPPVALALPEPTGINAPVPPALAATPEPKPISASAQPAPAAVEPEEVTVTEQMLTAIYLRNPKPVYPNLSRRLKEQGTVLLRVFVTVSGDTSRVELKKSSGFQRLDRAAMDAVHNWKFVPAKNGAQVIAAWVVVPIKFSLKG